MISLRSGFKVIHLIIFFILFILIILIFNLVSRYIDYKKNYEPFKKITDGNKVIINGNYITYVNVSDDYEEDSAKAYIDGKITDDVLITYYDGDERVFSIDTSSPNDYVVKYTFKGITATRVVIVCDRESPKFKNIDTLVLTDVEAANYDVNEGVEATDNSGHVTVSCDNSLGTLPFNYPIICKASDPYGNSSVKKRLIKVIKGIKFDYTDKLKITFPTGNNYVYKYSLDGGQSFIQCGRIINVDAYAGSIIAAVYLNDNLVMSNTYLIS